MGGLKARESVPALREVVETGRDIYLRAEALRSLIAIEGVEPLRVWLEILIRHAPLNVRRLADEALQERQLGDSPAED